jgi:hypothetical protein
MSAKNRDIATLLRTHSEKKNEIKQLRAEMLVAAVEVCGLSREAATKLDIEVFLDGYLVGQGSIQSWRLAANCEDIK